MLLKIRNDFPQVKIVTTGNASSNEPMIAINKQLGFKEYRKFIVGQIEVETLRDFFC